MKPIDLRNFLGFLMLNGRWAEQIEEVHRSACCFPAFVNLCVCVLSHSSLLFMSLYVLQISRKQVRKAEFGALVLLGFDLHVYPHHVMYHFYR